MAKTIEIGPYSAYAIAVANGYDGTEEEWLASLVGPRGAQGASITGVKIDGNEHIIVTIHDPATNTDTTIDAGPIDNTSAVQSIQQAAQEALQQVAASTETAQTAATQAAESASNAATSAQTATEQANAAGESAGQAANSASRAQESASAALTSQNAAKTSEDNAKDSETQAAASAAAAATSAEQAAASASEIGNQLEQAQTAITTAKNQAVSDVQAAGQSAVGAVEEAQTTAVESVEAAKTDAVEAVQDAGTAEAEKISGILPVPTEADNGKVLMVVDGKWTASIPEVDLRSWKNIQLIVRSGLAPQYFPVGYEFTTHDSTEDNDIIWRVVGHNTIKAANELLKYTMILETKYVYSNSSRNYISLQFDAPEALYCTETELQAGTYNFTLLAGYDTNYGGGKTYSFILTKPVPAGGVIMFPWGYNQQASETKISTYATQTDTSAIEIVGVTEGANGTSLGTADGSTPNMNHTHRIRYGSNNYAQSAARQWLSSKEAVGNVWKPQTKFDRPPTWANSRAGFVAGLPEDFLAAVQPAIVPCRTNSVYEVNSLDGKEFTISQTYNLQDRFFLLSRPEIYGTWDNAEVKDGDALEYYTGLIDAERIKYDPSGSARYCWLRSPHPGNASIVRLVNTSGALSSDSAVNALAAAPACIIA